MKKLVLKLIFGFIVLPLVIGGTLYSLNENGFFNISKIEVRLENAPANQEAFLNPLVQELEKDLQAYQGQSLWNIKLKKLSNVIDKEEWIETAALKRNWPSSLVVRVKPYEVKLLYLGKGSQLMPIIKDGQMLKAIDSRRAPDVALLGGEVFVKKPELRKKAVELMEEIPAQGSFSRKTISEIRFDQKEGFWMTMIKTGIQVKMGSDQIALKSARVAQVVDYLENRQFDARVIDANLSKKVLVRLRKDP
ncbi:Cell division protein FtsQ [compost metagenome]